MFCLREGGKGRKMEKHGSMQIRGKDAREIIT